MLQRAQRQVVSRDLVVDTGFSGLRDLLAARHTVHLAVLDEVRPGLMELERDIALLALLPKCEDPVVVTWARVGAGFPAGRDFFDFSESRYTLISSGVSRGAAMMALWRIGSARKIGRR